MNKIILSGMLRDVQHSHNIGNVSFNKANLIVKRDSGQEDIINLRFKSFSNKYKDNDNISLVGNVRSYSYKVSEDKNKVTIYVFTYFDEPSVEELTSENKAEIDGRICKMNPVRELSNGKHNLHFIVANNLMSSDGSKRLNSYIPCIAWGKLARELGELKINTKIELIGELRSREHKKVHEDGEVEFRVAHELLVTDYKVVE